MEEQSSTGEKTYKSDCDEANGHASYELSIGSTYKDKKLCDKANLSSALSLGSDSDEKDKKIADDDSNNLSYDSGYLGDKCGVSVPPLCGIFTDIVSTDDAVDESLQAELDELSFDTNLLDTDEDEQTTTTTTTKPTSGSDKNKDAAVGRSTIQNETEEVVENKQSAIQGGREEAKVSETIINIETDELESTTINADLVKTLSCIMEEASTNRKWDFRVNDKSLYQPTYIPMPRERRELEELAKLYLKSAQGQDPFYRYISPQKGEPNNVLLKREYVISRELKDSTQKIDQHKDQLTEIVLLSHGFLIAPVDFSLQIIRDKLSPESRKNMRDFRQRFSRSVGVLIGKRKKYDSCHSIQSILSINGMDPLSVKGTDYLLHPFVIQVKGHQGDIIKYEMHCLSQERRDAWMKAFGTSVSYNSECSMPIPKEQIPSGHTTKREKETSKLSQIKASMEPALSGFLERGDRLNEIGNKSSALKEAAKNYHDHTLQLKERLEKKNKGWFGRR